VSTKGEKKKTKEKKSKSDEDGPNGKSMKSASQRSWEPSFGKGGLVKNLE